MRLPVSPLPLIEFPLRFEKWMYPFAPLRRIGVSLLNLAGRLTRMRSATQSAGSWEKIQNEFGMRCAVLLYHHIGPLRPGMYPEFNVSAKAFERQVRWLALRGYNGILPSQWLRWLRDGTGLPEKPIMITFDDGYADIAQYALPILRRYGMGGTVFIVTGRIGETNSWDEAEGSGTLRLMTAEQIRYWADQGIEFGAHSRTHRDLCQMPETSRSAEIAGSKGDLAALLGAPVVSFAYPYSRLDGVVCKEVSEQFDLAFCGIEGLNFLRGDQHLLRRVSIRHNHSLIEFALTVGRGRNSRWMDRLRTKVALRTRLKKGLEMIAFGKPH
jgi:peptidoglycan/xylan/chitin deacetylase (PgdA/CDA1 family)